MLNICFCIIIAYKTVLHSYGLDSNPSTEEEENSDLELMEVSLFDCMPMIRSQNNYRRVNFFHFQDTPVQSNHMNNMMTDMYRTNASESRGPTAQNDFPIDISSDESDIQDAAPKSANNGNCESHLN